MADLGRTVEDRLREEYFQLLPEIRRVLEQMEAEARYHALPILGDLKHHERLVVKSRVKDCESAVDSLRRRQPDNKDFNRSVGKSYTLTDLNDLAGIRILVFPGSRLAEIDKVLRVAFSNWTPDPVEEHGALTAFTYYGYRKATSARVKGEYQIVPMLTGLFWEVEHSAMYKPSPELRGVTRALPMQRRYEEVLRSLRSFEEEFEKSVRAAYTPQQ